MNENENSDNVSPENGVRESAGAKFFTALVNAGVPAVLAAAIIGAVYAALVALGVLTLPGCTLVVDILPDESLHLEGAIEQQQAPVTVTDEK